jgi:hypothetical protein
MKKLPIDYLGAFGSTVGDVHFPKVKLLLPFDGSNAATTTNDESNSAHSVTFAGGAQISTAESKFGGSSLYLNGDSGTKLTISQSSDFDFGTGDFTIEFWIKTSLSNNDSQSRRVISFGVNDANRIQIFLSSDGIDFYDTGSVKVDGDIDVADGNWHHVAFTRSGTSLKGFVDGAQSGSTASNSTDYDNAAALTIGAYASTGLGRVVGYLEDLRITKGLARYTSAFTAPTSGHLTSAGDVNKHIVINSDADGVAIGTGGINQARIAKAWVRFDQTGSQSIDSSYNISSVTDTNTGISTLNFSTAMTDAEYSVVATGGSTNARYYASTWSIGTSSFQVRNFSVYDGSSLGEHYIDRADCSAIVFGN